MIHYPVLVPDLPKKEQLIPWLAKIDSNRWYTNFGPLVQEFELKLARLLSVNTDFLVTVSSGTAALELALLAYDLPKNSCVLVPSFSFPATATSIKRAGLCPIFTDVDPDTWTLTPEIAYKVLEKSPYSMILPVAAIGCPLPIEAWDKFNRDTDIPVLIDAAAAFGSQSIGSRCSIAYSFHGTKAFGIGEGGLVVAHSEDFIKKIKQLSNFGFDLGVIARCGCNAKMSEYHAAVGLAQYDRWGGIVKQRQSLLQMYKHLLKKTGINIRFQQTPENYIPALMPILIPVSNSLSAVVDYLADQGIQTRCWYSPPLHKHPAFAGDKIITLEGKTYLTVTENLSNYLLGLPFHSLLQEKDIIYICETLSTSLNGKK
ncbi:MAG: aminotransferase class I/II-fold pyridoxal phosphate-dependent enzyme [Planctomycetes bacterium]|nr:aminotransferase class I/II-fold pyridoxal phosphate-dependent enzyme [Planctomycetota bacterium]